MSNCRFKSMMYEEALPAAPLLHRHKGSRLLVVSAMLLVQCLCDPEAGIPQACKQHTIHGPCFQSMRLMQHVLRHQLAGLR